LEETQMNRTSSTAVTSTKSSLCRVNLKKKNNNYKKVKSFFFIL